MFGRGWFQKYHFHLLQHILASFCTSCPFPFQSLMTLTDKYLQSYRNSGRKYLQIVARATALEMFVRLRIAAEQGERVQNVYLAPKISYHGPETQTTLIGTL